MAEEQPTGTAWWRSSKTVSPPVAIYDNGFKLNPVPAPKAVAWRWKIGRLAWVPYTKVDQILDGRDIWKKLWWRFWWRQPLFSPPPAAYVCPSEKLEPYNPDCGHLVSKKP